MGFVQEFSPGDRVQVREGYTGTVLAEDANADPAYFVLLDEGKGEGWWDESEMERTAIRATAAHTAEVQRRVASEDYPELAGVLEARPDLPRALSETEHMRSLTRTAFYLPLDGREENSRTKAYQEGYEQGRLGTHQKPSNHDPAWMAQYLLGWAYGIKSRSQVPEPRSTDWLEADEPNIPEMKFDPEMDGPQTWLRSASLAKDAGFMDFLMGSPEPSDTWAGPGRNWSYDWCRFRRESHCWLPKELNREASNLAGYAVWVPEDRGHCKRVSWEAQEACPVPSQPGPNVPGGFTDATVAWEDGGQRGGYATEKIASKDSEGFSWHYTAAWTDVRRKAAEIKRAGRVRVLAVNMQADGLHPETFYGQVGSTTGEVYDTGLMFVPGGWTVAAWECTCKWAQYSWGRTRQWVKFEGRMCSHALAVVYEMQSRGMQGMPDDEDEIAPDWVPKAASRSGVTREDFPVVQALLDTGASIAHVQAALHRAGTEMQTTSAKGRVRGKINGVVQDLDFEDGEVFYMGRPYHGPVLYPDYDPYRGLDVTASISTEETMTTDPRSDGAWGLSLPSSTAGAVHEADLTLPSPESVPEPHEATLSATAAAVFSRAEQDEIIGEGEGRRASNLASLDLAGTHYVAVEDIVRHDDDPNFLW